MHPCRKLTQHRLTTIVGTGGIGKTTVALSIASQTLHSFQDGVWFVDLASLREDEQVSRMLAAALRIQQNFENPTGALTAYLNSRRTLIVLDNCEHLIGAAARLIEELIQRTDSVHILATSREPLCIREERVYRLPALESPAHSERLTAADAVSYSAIELFLERAAGCAGYHLTNEDIPAVADICRRLDGIPLAIELAAARLDSLALPELSLLLDDRLALLTRGRRTAPERHRTMTAALDWSYKRLSDKESILFRRLSVISGPFFRETAGAVAGGDTLSDADIFEALVGLIAKSLVTVDIRGAVAQYRLLDTTRAYALQKLHESGEDVDSIRRYRCFSVASIGLPRSQAR
jgi:predicted ATPase